MLYYLVGTLYVLVCLLLLLVVLLQQGRGGDIASAFGGGGTQTVFGARAGATILTKATTVLGTLFMIGSLLLAVLHQRGPGSVVSGAGEAPPVTAPAATPAPATPSSGPSAAPATEPRSDAPAAQSAAPAQTTPSQPTTEKR